MDQRTENELADLYESKLFAPAEIARRYGVPHQRVVAIAGRVWHERLVARFQKKPLPEFPGTSL